MIGCFCTIQIKTKEIETISVPVRSPKPPHAISMASYPIVHPHRILSYLFNEVGLHMSTSEVQQFWDHSRNVGEGWAVGSPASSAHIPLGMHGDAARLWTQYRVEKYVAIWLNLPLFRPMSSRHSRFLLFSVPASVMVKNRTLNRVWRRLVWSFEAAYLGINPLTGEGGRALTGSDVERAGKPLTTTNQRFSLCELRGDWEWFCLVWRFQASWQALNTCFACPARSKGDSSLLYHNVEDNSGWVQNEFTLEEFVSQRLKDKHLCNLTVVTNFFEVCWSLLITFLHYLGALDYGIQSHFARTEAHYSTWPDSTPVVWSGAPCTCLILAWCLLWMVAGWHLPHLTRFSTNHIPTHPEVGSRPPDQICLEGLRNSHVHTSPDFWVAAFFCSHRILLCEDLEWFGAGTLQDQLDVAYPRYVRYCKVNKVKQSQPPFTEKMVIWPTFVLILLWFLPILMVLDCLGATGPKNCPGIAWHTMAKVKKKDGKELMTCKAWNGRCVLSWLSNELLQALEMHRDNDLLALVCSCVTHGFFFYIVAVGRPRISYTMGGTQKSFIFDFPFQYYVK